MARTPNNADRDAKGRGRRAPGRLGRAAVAAFHRHVPRNFGVDLEPPPPRRPLRALLTVANLRAFGRALLVTRLDRSGARIRTLSLGVAVAYGVIAVKLVVLGVSHDPPQTLKGAADQAVSGARPDLVDRNGEILATDVKTMSVFAEPNRIIDKDEAVELITAVLPDVDARELRERLGSRKGFVWVKRQITPKEQAEIFHLGLPGVGFLPENKRVYPNGPIGAHVIGYVDKDNVGIAGMEKYLDQQSLTDPHVPGFVVDPESLKPVRLSLDIRATHALRDELVDGLAHWKAKAAAGVVMDVNTGEVIALESLPDYDPNTPVDAQDPTKINRINVGVYEMGSTFKALSIAMALDSGKVNLGSRIDARDSLRYGRFTIHDFHATHRVLTVPEVFTHSSNIGTARMALMVGVTGHQAFLRKMGQLDRLRTELPESAEPLVPKHWSELNTMTIAFGQGLNVAPLQALMAVSALANGGRMMAPTFLPRTQEEADKIGRRVVSEQTSESMRYLMRSNATHGSAGFANIPGYYVGGKTGTADKIIHGHYSQDKVFTTFMAVTPADKPKYLYLAIYDDPVAAPGDYGFHTAAWNAGRTAGALIRRIQPLEGLPPEKDPPTNPFPIIARLGYGADADRVGKE
ncbi:cell division protein FtsI (penicillin-binding protein 3) [Roseiarcus fermentans]|uniref:Cell division protein FtsI (Penicillin-binding protein 3) n=1 Tax=Roseiarcus fermentans TaxID=1473586 RepID=A0A366FSP9_9HYPH|nr:penicillin-binding protein 2 [Roseiarcus fermentans]RBP16749.1 cell division protein FtsI (penicillin-binding protein 3) [Roseiarcus fermentans]